MAVVASPSEDAGRLSARWPTGALLALSTGLAMAQSAQTDAPVTTLSEVVVTASGFEQEVKQAPASISVITREQLDSRPFRDLGEALQGVEGIDVMGSTGKNGGLDISIRGMPSEYTLILIDGRRQNVAGDVTPNGFETAHTSLLPPLSAIERIEIIRGPMSTLYGSDAMGGVVNIITRKVAKQWGVSAGVDLSVPESGSEGQQRKISLFASGPLVADTLGLALRGNLYERDASDRLLAGTGRDPRPGNSDQHTLGAKLSFTPNSTHDVWLDVEQARTSYDNRDCRLGTLDYTNCATGASTGTASGYLDKMSFNRNQLALGHTSRLGIGLLESSLMRSKTETVGRTIPTASRPAGAPDIGAPRQLETTNTVFDTKLLVPLGESHVLTTGAQWWDADLKDGLLSDKHSQTMWALFAEDEWQITDSLKATVGGRFNRHDAFGSKFSPRAYLVWDASPNWTVKGGISQGFRVPRLNQLIDGANGITGQGTVISIGNPNLKPETSTSTELGALFNNGRGYSSSVTLFHNVIKDRISSGGSCSTVWISSCAANPSAAYVMNIDEGKTWGLELGTKMEFSRQWSLGLNYTWTDSQAVIGGVKSGKLSDTARHMASAQLNWVPNERWSVWLRGEYRGKSRRFDGDPDRLAGNDRLEYQALGDLKAFSLLHVGAAYQLNKNVSFSASIHNLLDKNFDQFQAWTNGAGDTVVGSPYFASGRSIRGTAPAGRTLWLKANINF